MCLCQVAPCHCSLHYSKASQKEVQYDECAKTQCTVLHQHTSGRSNYCPTTCVLVKNLALRFRTFVMLHVAPRHALLPFTETSHNEVQHDKGTTRHNKARHLSAPKHKRPIELVRVTGVAFRWTAMPCISMPSSCCASLCRCIVVHGGLANGGAT